MPRHLAFAAFCLFLAGCACNHFGPPVETLVRDHLAGVVTIVAYDPDKAMPKLGGGFLIAPDRVVTARHMFAGVDRAEVRTHAGRTIAVRGIVAEDPAMDLVMVQLAAAPEGGRPLELALQRAVVGERLVAIGTPLGLEWTVSEGIVSGIRDIPQAGVALQHTVPVSPGSSGGPLIDLHGRVVAIQTSCITVGNDPNVQAGQSLNFGAPAERIARLRPGPLKTLVAARKEIGGGWVPAVTRNIDQASLRPFTRDDFKWALAFFEQRTRECPNEADSWFRLGLCHEKTGGQADAIAAYTRATTLDPNHAVAWNNLGAIRNKQKRYEDAVAALRRSLAIKPGQVEALNSIAVAYIGLKRYAEAIEPAAEAVRLNPKHAAAQYHLGEAYARTGQRDRALAQHKTLVPLDAALAQRLKDLIDRPATRPATRPAPRPVGA